MKARLMPLCWLLKMSLLDARNWESPLFTSRFVLLEVYPITVDLNVSDLKETVQRLLDRAPNQHSEHWQEQACVLEESRMSHPSQLIAQGEREDDVEDVYRSSIYVC